MESDFSNYIFLQFHFVYRKIISEQIISAKNKGKL